jgi:hypothetical protein
MFDSLKWLRAKSCPWLRAFARSRGWGGPRKWARANERPWNEDLLWWAATSENLEVLRLARENG